MLFYCQMSSSIYWRLPTWALALLTNLPAALTRSCLNCPLTELSAAKSGESSRCYPLATWTAVPSRGYLLEALAQFEIRTHSSFYNSLAIKTFYYLRAFSAGAGHLQKRINFQLINFKFHELKLTITYLTSYFEILERTFFIFFLSVSDSQHFQLERYRCRPKRWPESVANLSREPASHWLKRSH